MSPDSSHSIRQLLTAWPPECRADAVTPLGTAGGFRGEKLESIQPERQPPFNVARGHYPREYWKTDIVCLFHDRWVEARSYDKLSPSVSRRKSASSMRGSTSFSCRTPLTVRAIRRVSLKTSLPRRGARPPRAPGAAARRRGGAGNRPSRADRLRAEIHRLELFCARDLRYQLEKAAVAHGLRKPASETDEAFAMDTPPAPLRNVRRPSF